MQKVLRKRVLRDLKENKWRYLALGALIVLGMYLIVSIVGAAETIMVGTRQSAEKNQIEDGEFGVFVPLTSEEERDLTDQGIVLERMFYLDLSLEGESILRVFQNRENINLVNLDEGHLAEETNEVVLEKRYCEEHDITVGDQITLADEKYNVVGIASVPDYDGMYQNLSDSSIESKQFGIAFVAKDQYQKIRLSGKSKKSEEYQYAYRLNGKLTNEDLKSQLKELEIESGEIEDTYFQEYWDRTAGKEEELTNGVDELYDGSQELSDGLAELREHNDTLKDGAATIFESYLQQANDGLKEYGLNETLTEDNFESVLTDFQKNSDNGMLRLKLYSIMDDLEKCKAYKDGVSDYTEGVGEAADGSKELADGVSELKDGTDELTEELFQMDLSNLTFFMTADKNPRIGAGADDQVINKICGLIAGVIIMILFTYVISVFVIHGIEKESSVIGALYALGAKKGDLMLHYLMLPVLVTFLSGLVGTMIAFSKIGIEYQMQDCYDYFSIPNFQTVYPPYLIAYSVLMPALVAIIVNCMVIQKRLSKPVLSLIKNEQKSNNVSNLDLGNLGFISRFRIRQMLREARTSFTVIFGMFISLLIMMLGIDCYVMCQHISVENKEDTKYEYMYTYKYLEEKAPEDGEACFAKTLKKEIYGYDLDVTLLGIDDDNPYFDADTTTKKNEIVVSSAMAQKYHLKKGDQVVLSDEEEDMDYAFQVTGITQYSSSLFAFMDLDSMRELFGEGDDYYNVIFADHDLQIDSGRLYATTTKKEISNASDVFIRMMMPMIYMLCGVSAIIFFVVMYLMMKVMIDRSAFSISLIKIFGYRTKEIRKLYLNGNFYMIAVGAAVCIPLAKVVMDAMYPYMISNVSCGMNLEFTWQLYVGIYLVVILLYFIINQLLVGRLKKMVPAEVLKNRE